MQHPVTKAFLPPFEEYTAVLKEAWDAGWMTNGGALSLRLEAALRTALGVEHLLLCTNGTIVLQLALKALGVKGEVVTTPISYVATTTAILWEGCTPVFADVDADTLCIDPAAVEAAITSRTGAILATHLYGQPCDVEALGAIGARHNIPVIYDGAHAFGTTIHGRSVFSFGSAATCSFHATKLFHTGEGGCVVVPDAATARQLLLYRQFGHIGEEYFTMGINARASELQAALGLANLPYLPAILRSRRAQWERYRRGLEGMGLRVLRIADPEGYNHAYFPVIFPDEATLLRVLETLRGRDIHPRRYFYPALNTLPYVVYARCPVAEDVAPRVACLPMYYGLEEPAQDAIIRAVRKAL